MGRVRRYKKFKACDPFSKSKKSEDTSYDEPPDLFEERSKNSKKRKISENWDDEDQKELLLQREAMRSIKLTERSKSIKEKKIEPKRDDETAKEFKTRLRQETRKTLNEELHKMTATAKRRKEKLKERKLKKKEKKNKKILNNGNIEEEEVIEFSMSSDGTLRPSDLGLVKTSFPKRETVAFGETVTRPPNLTMFTNKMKKSNNNSNNNSSNSNNNHNNNNNNNNNNDNNNNNNNNNNTNNNNNKKKVKITERDDMDGDDGLEISKPFNFANSSISSRNNNNNNSNEMELMRIKVQEAYSKIREKRRNAQGAYKKIY